MNDPLARREFFVILAITIVAGMVRIWYPDRLGLDHFDEGIYALAGLWSQHPKGLWGLDSTVIPYAPPGLPILIGIAYAIFGVSDVAAILVSIVSGTLTIPAIGWLGRRAFGPGAGAAAAGLAALSGTHLLFSRMALTEATFLLAWVIGLGVGARFLEKPTLGRGLLMGLVVGVAMNLKYNGWLVGVLVVLTAVCDLAFDRVKRTPAALLRTFGFGGLGAFLAVLMYLPWYLFVEHHGGYAGLVAHHRGYVGGLTTWVPHWRQQLAQVTALSGGEYWLLAAFCLASTGLLVVLSGREVTDKMARVWLITFMGYGGIAYAMLPTMSWWASLMALPWLIRQGSTSRLVAIGWFTLTIVTPFYHPYARLWLPLHAFGWLIMSGLSRHYVMIASTNVGPCPLWRNPRVRWLAYLGLTVSLAALEASTGTRKAIPLPTPTGLYPIAWTQYEMAKARSIFASQPPASIRVYARPSVLFYLTTQFSVPIYRTATAKAALAGTNAGDYTLLDEGIFNAADFLQVPFARSIGWEEPLSPVSWLDIDPIAAYGLSSRRKVQVVLMPSASLRATLGSANSPLKPLVPQPSSSTP